MSGRAGSFLQGAAAVASRNLIVWKSFLGASVLGNFGEPILYLLALGFGLGRIVPSLGGMSYAEFIAPGLIVSTVMYTATFEQTYGAYTRLEPRGTFAGILATPITVAELVAGELLWGGVKATIGGSSVLLVVTAFQLVPSPLALAVLPLAFVAGLLFSAMALSVTAVARSYEFFNYYFTLVVAPMFLFSGIFFPLDETPRWTQRLAQVLPLTHVVALARALVRGTVGLESTVHLLVLLALTAMAILAAIRLMQRRLQQ